ncbi:MAG: class I SAM-dependent methyltransferase [Chloroflexota bacterium]|nr:class I SAM-dependent methyltransferase [Chloroflexota bacterium]
MYNELGRWWHLVSPPEEYLEEAEFFLTLLADVTTRQPATLLEIGSGGGNNALHMKSAFASVTLVDPAEPMLALSRQINPECEHLQGDMRTLRLGRVFDAVFIHDAIDYMTTLEELRQAFETAFVHCKSGGVALFVPDDVRETFEPSTEHGGEDDDERGVRYLEWSYDPDPDDMTCVTQYVFALRDGDQPVTVEHEEHVYGLFPRDEWLRLLTETGFSAHFIVDDYERHIFVARKP